MKRSEPDPPARRKRGRRSVLAFRLAAASLAASLVACGASGSRSDEGPGWNVKPDVPLTVPPYDAVHASWKQRLDEAYVFVDHGGDYRKIGGTIATLMTEAESQGVEPTGPLFCLYYDDPGQVAIDALRARACLPVAGPLRLRGPLGYDVLPGQPVVYAVVAGPYLDVPRAYPGLVQYLAERGWIEDGPWREIYLNPEAAASPDELLTEVQVPWTVP